MLNIIGITASCILFAFAIQVGIQTISQQEVMRKQEATCIADLIQSGIERSAIVAFKGQCYVE